MPRAAGPIRIRWWIFLFMSAFAMLSYMQRTSIAVAAEQMMPDLHLTQMQIGWLNAAFTTAYAIAQLPGGLIGQRFGARLTYTGVGLIGLMATIATPLAPVLLAGTALFIALLLAQGLLGASQGPVFPLFAGVSQVWFPERQWAFVNGLVSSGMNLGGALTPLLIVLLTAHFGWQGALLWVALPAMVLTALWAWYGRDTPQEHPSVSEAELAELPARAVSNHQPMTRARLVRILSNHNVLLLAFSYLCLNYAFYLLSSWSFLYLVQVRHFGGLASGVAGMLPWVGAGIGAGVGGYVSDWLVVRLGFRYGYHLIPICSLPLAALLLLICIGVSTPYAAVSALVLAFLSIELNEGAYWAATMRVAGADTAAATGVLNTGGNIGGIIVQPVVGALSGSGHWQAAFVSGAVFALLAALCWLRVNCAKPATQVITSAV